MKITFTVDTEKTADIQELEEYLSLLKKRHSTPAPTETAEEPEQEAIATPYHERQAQQERPVQQPIRRAQPEQPEQPARRAEQPARQAQGEPMERHKQAKEVPFGVYTAVLHDVFPDESKSGKRMMVFDFEITYGDYAKRHIFMRQVYTGTRNDVFCIKGIEKTINSIYQATGVAEFEFRRHSAQELESVVETVRDEIEQFDSMDLKIKYADGYTPITVIQ